MCAKHAQKRCRPASLSANSVDATRLRTGSPAVVVEDGVDAARWSMRQRHTVLEARARDDEDMSADILADAGDHRREEDEDGSAGFEGVGRVALQLVERMAARTRKQNAKSAGNV